MPDLINGVPADQWGTWCEHGKRIVEPDMDAVREARFMLACPYFKGQGACVTSCQDEPVCVTEQPGNGGSPTMNGWEVQANYPPGVIVEPWPCDADGCTAERFERDMEAEAGEHDAWQWDEYQRLTR